MQKSCRFGPVKGLPAFNCQMLSSGTRNSGSSQFCDSVVPQMPLNFTSLFVSRMYNNTQQNSCCSSHGIRSLVYLRSS